jgi:hypothetical protein
VSHLDNKPGVESSDQPNSFRKVLPPLGWTPSFWQVSQMQSLSFRALGVHTYLMSLPDDWEFSAKRIAQGRKEGRDAVEAALRELREAGLYSVEKTRDPETGKFKTITRAYAVPQNGNTKPQVAPEPVYQGPVNQGPVNQGSKKRDSKERFTPPPTSSTNAAVDSAQGRSGEEEDFPSDLKNFVLNLNYHGQNPGRAEYTRVAKALTRLWGHVHPADLKRRLQHNAGVGAQSLVAIYVKRLKEMTVDDFTVKSAPRVRQWCGRAAVCDPNTRRVIDGDGFITNGSCGVCG